MDDLLSRMLEIEEQGNAAVKEAEARAVEIRKESSAELAKLNSEFSAALAKECSDMESAALEEGQREYDSVIAAAAEKVEQSEAAFRKVIEPCEDRLYRQLLGIGN